MDQLESGVWFVLRKFADCVVTSFLWLLCCLPIVTIGASCSALYNNAHRVIRRDRDTAWSNFWRTFRSYFKKATKIWLVILAGLIVTALCWQVTYVALAQGMAIGTWNPIFLIPFLYLVVLTIYVFAYICRFDTGAKASIKNAGAIAVIHLHWTILMLVLLVVAILLVILIPVTLLFVPALLVTVYDLMLEQAFRRVMRPEDLEAEQKREEAERAEHIREREMEQKGHF